MLTLFAVVLSAPVLAQPPLAEVARKEAERRKSTPTATKVYTDKDLPATAPKPAAPSTSEAAQPSDAAAPANGEQPPSQQKPQGEQRNEAWWRARIAQAREELRRNEIFAESLQSRINALTREYALPLAAVRRHAVGEQRAEALTELTRVKQEIDGGKKQILDIEEEARKAGVPPGWLR